MPVLQNTSVRSLLPRNKTRCYLTCLALSLSIPAIILTLQKLLADYVSAASHGTIEQRFCIQITSICMAEWLVLLALWLMLRSRGESFRELGLWRWGTWPAWILAVGVALFSISNSLHILQRVGFPARVVLQPTGFHLYTALLIGLTAGFCEELIFRGYMMTEFARLGYGKVVQVIVPGLFFGLAHLAFMQHSVARGLGIILPTAIMGMIWGIAYLLGRRGLMPTIVAHFLNDSTALPWILFFLVSRGIR